MKTLVTLISFLTILLVALAGPLYKFGVLDLGSAFTALRYGVYVGFAALILILIQIIFMRKTINWAASCTYLVLLLVIISVPLSLKNKAKSVPAIHDISTDLVNPPQFVAIATLRSQAPNPVEYAGEETAEKQRQAYPQLTTQKYQQSTQQLLQATETAIKNLGWQLVNADKDLAIVEATDTSSWFGFKDDVVVRITANGKESNLDIRSKSRIGKSDLGKNAERIHTLIDEINQQLTPH
ncbi:DUF1499 domain-containing protein [Paraglaciecola aquimarina]|uniref:DUF1499 domain-containing protein n=1 Tax=Paraglaciecola aquimarina TaxID=1235557 RepID=A0ABU3SX90_9ALTE|nr:DUF1499 domain-containing protein [Paraglaciecola aquimarina]MDU0354619.1 DUF1499 domain-containing protein [Paraglaciecola aquimarina]